MYSLGLTATVENSGSTAEPDAPVQPYRTAPLGVPDPILEEPVAGPAPLPAPGVVPGVTAETVATSEEYSRDPAGDVVEYPFPPHTESAEQLFQQLPQLERSPSTGVLVALAAVTALTFFMAKGGRGV